MVRRRGRGLRAFARSASAIARSLKGSVVTAILLCTAFGTSLIFSQLGTATISGVVHDTTGALIPGVSITVKHVLTVIRQLA